MVIEDKFIIKAPLQKVWDFLTVLPGSMFLYALWNEIPILGVPACVVHDPATIFDLVLCRILAGESISRKEVARMGHGGLCLCCSSCNFPICPFGR